MIENTVDAPETRPPVTLKRSAQPLASATSDQSEEGEPREHQSGSALAQLRPKLFGFDGGAKPSELNNRMYQLAPEHPIAAFGMATVLSRDREGAARKLLEPPPGPKRHLFQTGF